MAIMNSDRKSNQGQRESGFSLVIALVFLVMLTLLGIGVMRMSSMQERMAGNAMDRALALEAAERTLREAEWQLIGKSVLDFNASCSSGLCAAGSAPTFSDDTIWGGTKDVAATIVLSSAADTNSKLATTPRWRGEYAGLAKSSDAGGWMPAYRITVRASGQSSDTRVFLQSVYCEGCTPRGK